MEDQKKRINEWKSYVCPLFCVGCVQLTSLVQHQTINQIHTSAGYFGVNEIKPFHLNLNANTTLVERKLSDHHIYGSKRLGIEERNLLLPIQSTYIHHDDFVSNITGWHPFEPTTQVTHEFHKLKLTSNELYAKAYRNFATEPGQTYKITLELDKGTAQAAGFIVYSSTSNPEVLSSIGSIAATGTYTVSFEAKSPVSSLQLMNLDGSGSTVDIYLLDMKVELVNGGVIARNRGDKRYELTNHLGDVMSTVTDRKIISASAQADELLQTGYEGGDYTLFANNQSYASMQTTDPNVLNASNHVILLDAAANGGAHYAPYIKRQVTYGDKIDISCKTWWVQPIPKGGLNDYNRGGSITYTLEDASGHRLLRPDGTEYWAELRVGASGLDANQWVTLPLPNYEIPLPSQLRTYNNKNVLYTGNVYITVIPWNAVPTNKTYYDDLSVTIDRNQSADALYAAEVMSASTYYPFGMTQWSAGGSDYTYGNDAQEKVQELGEGHYTAEYWEYDSRLGRRWNIDPVVKTSISSYAAFNNNPIFIIDPNGDNGRGNDQGVVTATVYFQFDADFTGGEQAKLDYIARFKDNVTNTWGNMRLPNGNMVNVSQVKFETACDGMTANDLKEDENLVTVGNGASDPTQPYNPTQQSYVVNNRTGYFYQRGGNPSYADHEFGHFLGLSDRYVKSVTLSHQSQNRKSDDVHGFLWSGTIPLYVKGDETYQPYNNLMSEQGNPNLSNDQLKLIFDNVWNTENLVNFPIIIKATSNQVNWAIEVKMNGMLVRNVSLDGAQKEHRQSRDWVFFQRNGITVNEKSFVGSKQGLEWLRTGNYVQSLGLFNASFY